MTGQQIARTQSAGRRRGLLLSRSTSPFIVNRTLRLVRPRLFIMMETEIWPNLLRACRRDGVKTMLVNGRISSRSYPRYRLARAFFRRVLADVDRFCMQSDESARRIVDIGADAGTRHASRAASSSIRSSIAGRTCAGDGRGARPRAALLPCQPAHARSSSRPARSRAKKSRARGVRRVRAHACRTRCSSSRHASRSGSTKPKRSCARGGLRVMRRTELRVDAEPRADVVVLDTIGELAQLFQIATVVFVGGSLVDQGGHNILEPAVYGKPIVFGPHMQNFAEIARDVPRQRGGDSGAVGAASSKRRCCELARRSRRAGAPRRRRACARRSQSRRQAARPRRLAQLLPPGSRGVVRPFRSFD